MVNEGNQPIYKSASGPGAAVHFKFPKRNGASLLIFLLYGALQIPVYWKSTQFNP